MSRRLLKMLLVPAVAALAASGVAVANAAISDDPPPTTMVVNGDQATENYPFLVYVNGCTGSLIKANWAVTAKHCGTPSSVRVGSVNRTSGGAVVGVSGAVSHPNIDIKLLKLSSSVSYAPIVIPSSSGSVGTATRIIGWGQTCAARGCGNTPVIAHQADVSIVADSQCGGINGTYEICTSNNGGTQGACYGDSGGPQVRKVNGTWQLIGVTSRAGNSSSTCATAPSIYGDLPSVRSWLDSQVGGLPSSSGGGTEEPPSSGNLATSASASASYTSSWESVAAVNDGREPSRSNDTQNPRWGTWPQQGEQWVQLTWSSAQSIKSAQLYFFDDNGGVRLPSAYKVQYWTGSAWANVSASSYPIAANQYNSVSFSTVSTTRLRVVLTSGQASVGLLEFKAYA